MKPPTPKAFDDHPRTPRNHFLLHLYAAVFLLMRHLQEMDESDDEGLEKLLERYPFLAGYCEEVFAYMPDDLMWSQGADWWHNAIRAWEVDATGHLPLTALTRDAALNLSRRIAFTLVGLVEEDSRFGTLFAELQAPLADRRPSIELMGRIIDQPGTDGWTLCRPLLNAGLITAVNPSAPRSERMLKVPSILWDATRGDLEAGPGPGYRYQPRESLREMDQLVVADELGSQIQRLPALIRGGRTRTLVLRDQPGGEPETILGAVARELGRGLITFDKIDGEDMPPLAGPLAVLTGALPVLSLDLGPGEIRNLAPMTSYGGPVALVLGSEGGVRGPLVEKPLTLTLPTPNAALRKRLWRQAACESDSAEQPDDARLDHIAEHFHLGPAFIRQAAEIGLAHAALEGRDRLSPEDVRQATRALGRHELEGLATHLDRGGSWDHLIAGIDTLAQLRELERRCRHRERLLDHLGPAFGTTANRGVRALFSGPSGTGKTLAAKILAAELGTDLYRVDLASVVNKYIGETEKNLHQVLSRAEALDVVLLLDEGDSLLGGRTDVKSANDRYANLETNFLLQRLETFDGIVLITTNLMANIDSAFQRRMDAVVPFFPPRAEERWMIFEIHLPEGHTVTADYLERVAVRCELTGGQIRNVALHAALLALDGGGGPVDRQHLEAALRTEYRKAGATFPMDEQDLLPRDGGMESFAAALAVS